MHLYVHVQACVYSCHCIIPNSACKSRSLQCHACTYNVETLPYILRTHTSYYATCLYRLLECWPQLKLLDVSGNEQLGNLGCLELVRCCSTMTDLKLKLASCGMQSPLSNELIKVLMELVLKNRIDIAGNVIDPADRKQIFSLS